MVANGSVALIALVILLILAYNYIRLLFEAAERYILLGVLVFTAPVAFAMGAAVPHPVPEVRHPSCPAGLPVLSDGQPSVMQQAA